VAIVRRLASDELGSKDVAALRDLFRAAWGNDPEEEFGEDDWEHAVGGVHFLAEEDGAIVAHASVVERELHRLLDGGLDERKGGFDRQRFDRRGDAFPPDSVVNGDRADHRSAS